MAVGREAHNGDRAARRLNETASRVEKRSGVSAFSPYPAPRPLLRRLGRTIISKPVVAPDWSDEARPGNRRVDIGTGLPHLRISSTTRTVSYSCRAPGTQRRPMAPRRQPTSSLTFDRKRSAMRKVLLLSVLGLVATVGVANARDLARYMRIRSM